MKLVLNNIVLGFGGIFKVWELGLDKIYFSVIH